MGVVSGCRPFKLRSCGIRRCGARRAAAYQGQETFKHDRYGAVVARPELEYLAAVSLCKIVNSHGMEKWTGCPVSQAHEARCLSGGCSIYAIL